MTYEMELLVRHNDGIREGIAIGREEGSNIRAQKIALSMLREQIPLNVIVKCTSLSEQEIHDLAKEHNLL